LIEGAMATPTAGWRLAGGDRRSHMRRGLRRRAAPPGC
jgi:hypothetical protein